MSEISGGAAALCRPLSLAVVVVRLFLVLSCCPAFIGLVSGRPQKGRLTQNDQEGAAAASLMPLRHRATTGSWGDVVVRLRRWRLSSPRFNMIDSAVDAK